MRSLRNQIALSLLMLTNFALASEVQQPTQQPTQQSKAADNKYSAQIESIKTQIKLNLPPELRMLPKILDNKILDFKALTNMETPEIDESNFQKVYGPGAGGGGNVCALNATMATQTILIELPKSGLFRGRSAQFAKLKADITQVEFKSGADLVLRDAKVNAINYPDFKIIVMDSEACSLLSMATNEASAFLLHEYLGVAGIDDTKYQVSGAFRKYLNKIAPPAETGCRTHGCDQLKNDQQEAAFKWMKADGEDDRDCDGYNWITTFKVVDDTKYEFTCGDNNTSMTIIIEADTVPDTFPQEFSFKRLYTSPVRSK